MCCPPAARPHRGRASALRTEGWGLARGGPGEAIRKAFLYICKTNNIGYLPHLRPITSSLHTERWFLITPSAKKSAHYTAGKSESYTWHFRHVKTGALCAWREVTPTPKQAVPQTSQKSNTNESLPGKGQQAG